MGFFKTIKMFFLCAAVLSLTGCTHLFFQPSKEVFADPADFGLRSEAVKFKSVDGTELTGLFFPSSGTALGTIVHFHGNARNMTSHFPFSAWLAKEGFNVFILDYRGYGASGGKPSLDGLVLDAKAALEQAKKLPGAEADKIIIFGQSLGGAVAVAAIGESGFKPAALVLEGTFYSYKGVGSAVLRKRWWTWPFSWLPWLTVSGRHSPSDYIGAITCPKLFIHSEKDFIVPFSQGRKLYNAAVPPKEFWPVPYGHIDAFYSQREANGPRLVEFLKKALLK